MILAHSFWTPLAVAFFGALGGGFGGGWAVFKSADKEWHRREIAEAHALQRKRAQARRALQIEMLMNAQRLRIGAICQRDVAELQQRVVDFEGRAADVPEMADDVAAIRAEMQEITRPNILVGRDFSAAFRGYFTDATEGVAWTDVSCLLNAYGTGEVLFEGSLVVDPVRSGEDLYKGNAASFCKAIRAISKYERLEDAFYGEVEKLEQWLAPSE